MPGTNWTGFTNTYLSIVGGKLRQKVDKETEGAVHREYELPSGEKGEKWELVYKDWSGIVRDLYKKDTDFGTMFNVVFDDAVISMNTDSRFFQDFVKKFASADLKKAITLSPYDFEDKDGKKVTGLTVTQNGVKLSDYFYDFETKKYKHDFPKADHSAKKPYDKDDWKAYFIGVKKFLLAYVELALLPKLERKEVPLEVDNSANDDAEKQLDEVPF